MKIALTSIATLCLLAAANADETPSERSPAPVFTGGVVGVQHLTEPDRSGKYRAAGGALYIHNDGWHRLSDKQRRLMLDVFQGAPIAVELGFIPIDGWPKLYRRAYVPYGIQPTFIAANAFDQNNSPTPQQWERYTRGLRAAGVKPTVRILPTFEYANFGENLKTLADNQLSDRTDFQQIVRHAGGMVIDSPPQYFFQRERHYRDWIIDAIRWCRTQKLHCVVIVSPHHSGAAFPAVTDRFIAHLRRHEALPDAWVCENYSNKVLEDFPNRMGHEDQPATTLGVGLQLLRRSTGE